MAWVLLGVGAAGAGAGAYFTVKANKKCNDGDLCLPAMKREKDGLRRKSYIAFGIGGAALVASVVLFLVSRKGSPAVTVAPTPGGAIGAATWQF